MPSTQPPTITPEIHATLLSGGTLFNPETGAMVRVEAGRFVMHGRTGRHDLEAASTNAARLNAHWRHFAAQ